MKVQIELTKLGILQLMKNIFYFLFWVNLVWCSNWRGLEREIPSFMKGRMQFAGFISRIREKLAIYEKQEQEFIDLQHQLLNKEQELIDSEQKLLVKEQELIDLEQKLLAKDDILTETNSQAERLDYLNFQMRKELSCKSEEIIKLEAGLREGNSYIETLKSEISERSKNDKNLEIEINKRNLEEKDLIQKCFKYQEIMLSKDNEIKELKKELCQNHKIVETQVIELLEKDHSIQLRI
jgi:chromosome segregation ATPase